MRDRAPSVRDRAPIFVAFTDLLICLLCYVLISVAPVKAKVDGVKPVAWFLISAEWNISLDSDVDLWVIPPQGKPVFYGSRQVGCTDLDHDDLGNPTSQVTLADGSMVHATSHKETTSIRCLVPGHYDVGVNLYSDREIPKGAKSIPVHVEITGLNPQVTTLFAGDAPLDHRGATINVVSFDLSSDGKITLTGTPLAPVTDTYRSTGG
jgi:hypothetical protein